MIMAKIKINWFQFVLDLVTAIVSALLKNKSTETTEQK